MPNFTGTEKLISSIEASAIVNQGYEICDLLFRAFGERSKLVRQSWVYE